MDQPAPPGPAAVANDPGPLAETVARITAAATWLNYRVQPALPPAADGDWRRLPELADPALLGAWHARLAESTGDRRVAAAYMAGWLSSTLVSIWLLPVLVDARLPLAPPEATAVRHHPGGWFDGMLLADGAVGLLAEDPAAAWPGARVLADRAALFDGVAARLLALAPLLEALRAACPIGLPALWGGVADMVGMQALLVATTLRRDRVATWQEAEGLLDRLQAGQPRLRVRPRAIEVVHAGVRELASVRGTCCLAYRTCADADPDGEGYCDHCPLRTETSRLARLRAAMSQGQV